MELDNTLPGLSPVFLDEFSTFLDSGIDIDKLSGKPLLSRNHLLVMADWVDEYHTCSQVESARYASIARITRWMVTYNRQPRIIDYGRGCFTWTWLLPNYGTKSTWHTKMKGGVYFSRLPGEAWGAILPTLLYYRLPIDRSWADLSTDLGLEKNIEGMDMMSYKEYTTYSSAWKGVLLSGWDPAHYVPGKYFS